MNWWRRLSIVAKLPLGIGLLLLLVLGGMTGLAWVDLRRSARALAAERLNRVTPDLAAGLAGSAVTRSGSLGALARDSVLTRFLAAGGDVGLRERVEEEIRDYADEDDAAVIELWDSAGRRVYSSYSGSYTVEPTVLAERSPGLGPGTSAAMGPLLREGDRALTVTVAVLRRGEALLGYITDRRPITATPEAVRATRDLVGEGSRVLFGNVRGDVWTDLQGHAIERPPVDVLAVDGVVEYQRADTPVIARAAAIAGTPWLILIELGQGPVYGSATRFLRRGIILTLLLTAVGATVAYITSRRISLPLRGITDAAEALAAGEEMDPVPVTRSDEIGRLAASFNAMAEEVRRSHQLLEDRVARRTAELQEANQELESFSYSVSHDLRAPLRAVDGFAAILVEDHGDELSADAQRYLVRIRTSAQQMGALIDDLLAFSRLGRQEIRRAPVDMRELARVVVEEVCRQEKRDVSEVHIGDLPPTSGERSMLKQVFVNLVQNALKYTRGKQPAHIVVDAVREGDEVVYFVKDDGVGFDMRYADKLFGVFQRLHPAEEFEGTGVGLAVVKRVVERHGGRIWAESAPGEGATFRFTVPPVPVPAERASES